MKMVLSILLSISMLLSAAPDPAYVTAVTKVLHKYQRPVTILQLGAAEDMVQARKDDVNILLTVCAQVGVPSVTVLAPPVLTIGQLDKLAQCEHIDIVIVHDISAIKAPLTQIVGTVINLGEHMFICADYTLEKVLKKSSSLHQVVPATKERAALYYSYRQKRYLSYARFTQRHPSQRGYEVHSTYTDKSFIKEGGSATPWVHGINLVTFVMLNGVSPTDEEIKRQFLLCKKKYPDHTDLVLGNIIVQGTKLIAIDGSDARRSASLDGCINAAVTMFDKAKLRQEDPKKWLDEYTKLVYRSR